MNWLGIDTVGFCGLDASSDDGCGIFNALEAEKLEVPPPTKPAQRSKVRHSFCRVGEN